MVETIFARKKQSRAKMIKNLDIACSKMNIRHPSRELTNQDVALCLASSMLYKNDPESLSDERREAIHDLIAKRLNSDQVTLIRLKFWEAMSIRDIAKELNLAPSQVFRRIRACLNILRS